MGQYLRGDVVTIPFPFSNLSDWKRRPALVIAQLTGDDAILCQITSSRSDHYSIELTEDDFCDGSLPRDSHIRPNRLFTADMNIVIKKNGTVSNDKIDQVVEKIIRIIT